MDWMDDWDVYVCALGQSDNQSKESIDLARTEGLFLLLGGVVFMIDTGSVHVVVLSLSVSQQSLSFVSLVACMIRPSIPPSPSVAQFN